MKFALPTRLTPKQLRIGELLLVLGVAFAGPLFISTYFFLSDAHAQEDVPLSINFLMLSLQSLSAILVLVYVLFRQKRTLADIGVTWRWKDLPYGLALFVSTEIIYITFYLILYSIYLLTTGNQLNVLPENVEFAKVGITIASLIFLCVNACYEELIVRAYLMTEVQYLTNRWSIAVIVSVLLQTSYHLYQGLQAASLLLIIFTVFALFFAKWKKVTPIIIAHFLIDFMSFGLSSFLL